MKIHVFYAQQKNLDKCDVTKLILSFYPSAVYKKRLFDVPHGKLKIISSSLFSGL